MAGVRIVLGPQRPTPNVPEWVEHLPGEGPVLAISAGWRLDEVEQPRVLEDLGVEVLHLPLYKWFEQIHARELLAHQQHSARQKVIREAKRLHRYRLEGVLSLWERLGSVRSSEPDLLEAERQDVLQQVRNLDARYLATLREIEDSFPEVKEPWRAGVAATAYDKVAHALEGARGVLVAGGHVGVLYTRMRFFGLDRLLADAVEAGTGLIAWSAGAMALSDRVVLFDDDPPDGPNFPELFDRGFGLMPDAVFFPHARQRLRLDDVGRVARLVERFAPAPCIGLEPGAALLYEDGRWVSRGRPEAAFALTPDGGVKPWEAVSA